MPTNKCCVPGCISTVPQTVAFVFPRDPGLRYRWTQAIQRPGFIPTRHSVVCRKHFSDDQLDEDWCKPVHGAVPTLALEPVVRVEPIADSPEDMVASFDDFKANACSKLNLEGRWFVHVMPSAVHIYSINMELYRSPIRVRNDVKVYPSLAIRVFIGAAEESFDKLRPFLGEENKIVRWSQLRKILEEYDDTQMMSVPGYYTITLENAASAYESDVDPGIADEVADSDRETSGPVNAVAPQDTKTAVDFNIVPLPATGANSVPKTMETKRPPVSPRNKKCFICVVDHATELEYELHLKGHMSMLPYRCDRCTVNEVLLQSIRKVNQHFQMHMRPLKCKFCDWRFTTHSSRDDHEHYEHVQPTDRIVCEVCGKQYKSHRTLRTHMRFHENPHMVTCKLCSRVLSTAEELKMHLAAHSGIKLFKCPLCEKSFTRRSNLVSHKQTHIRPLPDASVSGGSLKCEICGKLVTSLGRFHRHKRLHEKLFQCTQCNYKTSREKYLRDHQNSHTGERPHKCKLCPEAFRTYSGLKRHRRKHGTEMLKEGIAATDAMACTVDFPETVKWNLPKLIPGKLTTSVTAVNEFQQTVGVVKSKGPIVTDHVVLESLALEEKFCTIPAVPEPTVEEIIPMEHVANQIEVSYGNKNITVWNTTGESVDISNLVLSYQPDTIYYYTQ